jgi:hypothetical protein
MRSVEERTIPENMPACLFCVVLRVARTSGVFVDVEARVVSAIPPVASPNLDSSGRPSTVHAEERFVLIWYCDSGFTTVNRVARVVHRRGVGASSPGMPPLRLDLCFGLFLFISAVGTSSVLQSKAQGSSVRRSGGKVH